MPREIRDALVNGEHTYDIQVAQMLKDSTIGRWELFYDSVIQNRDAKNIKVAYLCGPNPENDLRVFCEAGVLPEHIWAFESDQPTYNAAVISALQSEFPFIKIINGGIDVFLEASPARFDIIYLDFCGLFPNRNKKQKTLLAIYRILFQHSLNSPGVLISNVSLPTVDGDPDGRKLLAKLVVCYLYPKEFLEPDCPESEFTEGPIAHGKTFEEWLGIVEEELDHYYGQFITRVIIDQASFISPYTRLPKNSPIYQKFFSKAGHEKSPSLIENFLHFDANDDGGDVIADPGVYPILWAFTCLDSKSNRKDTNYPQLIYSDIAFGRFAENFLAQLHYGSNKDDLVKDLAELTISLLATPSTQHLLSDTLRSIVGNHSFSDYYQFCDLVLANQIVELLFRQISVPYHVNVEKSRRWKYKAKSTPCIWT